MMKRKDKRGRRKGSRNKGYFYRVGRGWFTKVGKTFFPLTNEMGERLKDKATPAKALEEAHARHLLTHKRRSNQNEGEGVTVEQVCNYYLDRAKRESRSSTLEKRADTLFDLCYGFPAQFRDSETRKAKRRPQAEDRIHPGYGRVLISELRPYHLEQWLEAHKAESEMGEAWLKARKKAGLEPLGLKGWASDTGRRTRLQAVKRALNRAAKGGLIPKEHPIRGMLVPKSRARVTYLTDEQEAELLRVSVPMLRLALRVLIRTGMRPGCEFAKLTAEHVIDRGDRLELQFDSTESKNNKKRVVRIKETWLMEEIRKHVKRNPSGALFRNGRGEPWKVNSLSRAFRRAVERSKVKFDADVCLYSCRHTFAKRALIGYWTGKPINMELLASLMGNTPAVCAQHYADILKELSGVEELLWTAC